MSEQGKRSVDYIILLILFSETQPASSPRVTSIGKIEGVDENECQKVHITVLSVRSLSLSSLYS